MLPETNTIRAYFGKLGLETEIADLYLALHAHGPQTISELSRNARVERTRIYRLIDKLLASNLVEVETHHKRGIIKAAPIANLHILINEKAQELKSLQDELGLIEQVLARNSLSSANTRVQFYQGSQGIRQMLWNQLKATTEIVGYNYQVLDMPTGVQFMARYREEFEARELRGRVIGGDEFAKSLLTSNPPGANPSDGLDGRIKNVIYHTIDARVFSITNTTEIYDNVVCYYNWKDAETFGIEIHNNDIADAQRQLFEMLWVQSTPETRF